MNKHLSHHLASVELLKDGPERTETDLAIILLIWSHISRSALWEIRVRLIVTAVANWAKIPLSIADTIRSDSICSVDWAFGSVGNSCNCHDKGSRFDSRWLMISCVTERLFWYSNPRPDTPRWMLHSSSGHSIRPSIYKAAKYEPAQIILEIYRRHLLSAIIGFVFGIVKKMCICCATTCCGRQGKLQIEQNSSEN